MIKAEILEKLVCFTDEELSHINGIKCIDTSIFLNNKIIDYHKLLEKNQLISVRKHARFFDYPSHSHNYIEMSYVYGGRMTHIIGDHRITINEGEIILLNRNIEHAIEKTCENDIIFNFIINPVFFDYISSLSDGNIIFNFILDTIYSHQLDGGFLLFHSSGNEKIKNHIEDIITNLYEIEYSSTVRLKLVVGLLLIELMSAPDIIESYQDESYDKILCTSVLNYISKNYKIGTLQEIANQLHQPDYKISKLMKQYTGETFKYHLTHVKLEKAIALLEQTTMSVNDIMITIGYENQTHFYKVFKNHYQMTPNEYRLLRKSSIKQ